MQRRLRHVLLTVLTLALVASSCSSTTTIAQDDDTGLFDDPAPTADTAAESNSAVESDGAGEPDAEPEPSPGPESASEQPEPTETPAAPSAAPSGPVGAPYESVPTSGFTAPADWADPLPVDVGLFDYTLANGTRVMLRQNGSPGSQAQLRLVVNAGSIHEDPDSLGSAHFLEHMMFNGTEQFPGNEIVPVLEGFGAGFGADINAYTSFSETVYQLTVPTRDFADLELAVEVLGEWASAAIIDPEAVIAERGVVREEYRRSQESSSGRLGSEFRDVVFAGTVYADREPIGTINSIESMTAPELRAYYERWYRPDNITVIAVGDFDVDRMRATIDARFGPRTESATDAQPIDDVTDGLAEPLFDVYVDPELTRTDVQITWRLGGGSITSRDDLREAIVREVAMTALDVRLFESVQRQETVLLSARSGVGELTSNLDLITLRGQSDAEAVPDALDDLLLQMEQLRQYPVSANEFDRAVERVVSTIEQAFAESGSVQDSFLAQLLVEYALGGDIVVPPNRDRDAQLEVLQSIEPIDLQAYFHQVLSAAPYVLATGPASQEAALPEPEELAGVYASRVGVTVAAPDDVATAPTELMERPEPAGVIDEAYVEPLDAIVVTYDNGARLAFRRTTIVENRVEFQAWSRGGFFQEDGPVVPLLGRAGSLVVPSGFESLDTIELDQILGGSVATLSADIGRAVDSLSGESSTEDVETLFQLVHLQMTEPTIADLQVRRFDEIWRPLAENPEARPQLAADLRLWSLRYGDSPWFRLLPTVEDLDALDAQAQLDAFSRRFDNAGDFVFVVVGDADVNTVIDLGARYIGTLPATADREVAIDRDPGVPEENLIETIAVGVGDQGRLRINWESPYEASIQAEVWAQALEIVVDARLRDLIREQLGASYAPRASVAVLREPKPWVDTIIELDGDPERLDEISVTIRDELARIRVGDFDPEYLSLAINQLTEDYRFYSNPDWIAFITTYLADESRSPNEHRLRTDIALALTVTDIAETAKVVFPETRSVEVRMVPAG